MIIIVVIALWSSCIRALVAELPRAPKSMGGAGDALEGRWGELGGLLLLVASCLAAQPS